MKVLVLADTAFSSNEFVTRVRRRKHHALVGIRCNRKLEDGRILAQLHKRGQQLRLLGLKFPVYLSWYYFKRSDGKLEKRYVLSTKALKGSTITWWGRRRWQIEGFFKTAKHRCRSPSFWSTDPVRGVQVVNLVLNRLPTSLLGSSQFRKGSFTGLG